MKALATTFALLRGLFITTFAHFSVAIVFVF
jgi:hypothetical protein